MKRWITLAALVGLLATSAPSTAADFPFTTSSSKPKKGTRLLGDGGILFPWLNRSGNSSKMDAGRGKAARGAAATGASARRANGESTGVLPNNRMSGSMFKK